MHAFTDPTRAPGAAVRLARAARCGLLAVAAALPLLAAHTQACSQTPSTPKVASDLRLAIEAATPPRHTWVRELGGKRWVRVVVTGQKSAWPLAEARKDLQARGGRVLGDDAGTFTVLAMMPAAQVGAFAARADVLQVAPDRLQATAAAAAPVNIPTQAHLAAVGLSVHSARARSDLALAGE